MRNIWQKMTTYMYTCLFLRDFALIMYFLSEMLNQGSIMNKKNCRNSKQRCGSILGKWCRSCTHAPVPHRRFNTISI